MANSSFHYIKIYDQGGLTQLVRIDRFSTLWYEDTLDKGAQAEVKIPYDRPELTRANLEGMNRVKIYKGDTQKWEGFINRWVLKDDEVTINMVNLMGVLEKRLVTEDFSSQPAGDIFASIISDMNITDDTGITASTFEYGGEGIAIDSIDYPSDTISSVGHLLSDDESIIIVSTGDMPIPLVSQTPYYVVNRTDDTFGLSLTIGGGTIDLIDSITGDLQFKSSDRAFNFINQTALSALRNISSSVGSEFFIDFGFLAKCVISRGSDKSNGEVDFKQLDDRPNESNIQSIDVVYDMGKVYNRITGTGNSISSTKQDSGSQSTYGYLEQVISFLNISDQRTMNQEVLGLLGNSSVPFETPKAIVVDEKISESLYDVGDNVSVRMKKGFYELDESFRIVSKRIIVRGDNQQVDVEVGLGNQSQSRADILDEIAETVRRVYNLERA